MADKTYVLLDDVIAHIASCERSDMLPVECSAITLIKNIPSADVAEVRHGSWHRYSKGSGSYNGVIIMSDAFQCTVCKESVWNKSDYCPNCGAKMDGKTNE